MVILLVKLHDFYFLNMCVGILNTSFLWLTVLQNLLLPVLELDQILVLLLLNDS